MHELTPTGPARLGLIAVLLAGCGSSNPSLGGSGGHGAIGGHSAGGTSGGGTSGGGTSGGGTSGGGTSGAGTSGGGTSGGGTSGAGTSGAGTSGGGTSGAGTSGGGTSGGGTRGGGTLAGCTMFPADNPWNQDVSGTALNAMSATYLAAMNPTRALHPDWGTMTDGYGIPFSSGTGAAPQPMTWTESWGSTESDMLACATGSNKFCYPIPLTAPIEGGSTAPADWDRHVLYVDTAGGPSNCTLYELYQAQNPTGSSGWSAANGAIWHLGSNALRPEGWTSADAAGLPVLAGLVRLDEVISGEIKHAIRFTVNSTSQGWIHPATHQAGSASSTLPPMGLRLRLKASFNTSTFSGPTLVILTAMKKYGVILADNGSDWFISGESNNGWSPYMDAIISGFSKVHGSDFEAVDTGPVLH